MREVPCWQCVRDAGTIKGLPFPIPSSHPHSQMPHHSILLSNRRHTTVPGGQGSAVRRGGRGRVQQGGTWRPRHTTAPCPPPPRTRPPALLRQTCPTPPGSPPQPPGFLRPESESHRPSLAPRLRACAAARARAWQHARGWTRGVCGVCACRCMRVCARRAESVGPCVEASPLPSVHVPLAPPLPSYSHASTPYRRRPRSIVVAAPRALPAAPPPHAPTPPSAQARTGAAPPPLSHVRGRGPRSGKGTGAGKAPHVRHARARTGRWRWGQWGW